MRIKLLGLSFVRGFVDKDFILNREMRFLKVVIGEHNIVRMVEIELYRYGLD